MEVAFAMGREGRRCSLQWYQLAGEESLQRNRDRGTQRSSWQWNQEGDAGGICDGIK